MIFEIFVIGMVSFEEDKKGINMFCIMCSFYKYVEKIFSFEVLEYVLKDYKVDFGSFDVCI